MNFSNPAGPSARRESTSFFIYLLFFVFTAPSTEMARAAYIAFLIIMYYSLSLRWVESMAQTVAARRAAVGNPLVTRRGAQLPGTTATSLAARVTNALQSKLTLSASMD